MILGLGVIPELGSGKLLYNNSCPLDSEPVKSLGQKMSLLDIS
jgi:hypothetical protein